MATLYINHLCNYCGGWTEEKEDSHGGRVDHVGVMIDQPAELPQPLRVCFRCIKKVLDTVLGEPK